jgi:hypothetical protein
MKTTYHEYVGNIHVHTNISDGAQSPREIAQIAETCGLDFIMLADHMNQAGRLAREHAGYHGEVLVIVGAELGSYNNHYLAFGIEEKIDDEGMTCQQKIDSVKAAGGLGFIAHPNDEGTNLVEEGTAYPWTDWNVERFTGIELWNFMSDWKAGITDVARALYWIRFPVQKLTGPRPETLARWDALCCKRRIVAIGGSDAHARPVRKGPLSAVIFPYEKCFKAINTHIFARQKLRGRTVEDTAIILEALSEGRCYLANSLVAPPEGFNFYCRTPDGTRHPMGSCVRWQPGTELIASAGARARIDLVRHGEPLTRSTGLGLHYRASAPGIYRVELRRKGLRGKLFPWIFSNPIYLYGGEDDFGEPPEEVFGADKVRGDVIPLFGRRKKK